MRKTRLHGHRNVFECRELRQQFGRLENTRHASMNAFRRAQRRHLFSIENDGSAVLLQFAENLFENSRLARAVWSYQCQALTLEYRQTQSIRGRDASKSLVQAVELKKRSDSSHAPLPRPPTRPTRPFPGISTMNRITAPTSGCQYSVRLENNVSRQMNTIAPASGPNRYTTPPRMTMISNSPDLVQCSMSGLTKRIRFANRAPDRPAPITAIV